MAAPFTVPRHPFSWLAYAQLLRLPNVFTAVADICLTAFAVGALPDHGPAFLAILGASACLYLGGMVWNDVFDLDEDKRDRSFRPLPSGRVSLKNALALGMLLMGGGVLLAALAGRRAGGFDGQPLLLAGLLAGNIFFYDAWLKHTILGPVAMGGCRFLNVLLGLSMVPGPLGLPAVALALVVGIYIAGVTWFARTEASVSNQQQLLGAAGVMAFGLLLSLLLPELWKPPESELPGFARVLSGQGYGLMLFPYLLVAFGLYLALPLHRAIRLPSPALVQAAVKRCILGLILLDAILAAALAGLLGLAIVGLLLPARFLGRWVYST